VRIDFDAGKLAFLQEAGKDPGVAGPLTFSPTQAPVVSAEIAGAGRAEFVVDTGASGRCSGMLRRDLFQALLGVNRLQVVGRVHYASPNGYGRCRLGQAKGIAVGPFQVPDAVFGEADMSLLGLGYLSRYTVTFDFPKKVMYLKKGKRFAAPDRWDTTGLSLKQAGGRVVVHAVEEGTAAAACGLRKGDVVLSLAGKAADKLTLYELADLLYSSGKQVRIKVKRSEKEIEATLRLGEQKSP
jgi:hypothetical protein